MDWNALKNKAVDLGNKAMDKSLSALEKASSHTYEGLKKTPVSIKNGAEFDDAKSAPLLMVVVVGKEDAASKSVLARMPVIFKDVWIYSASLKVVLADEVPELVSALGVSDLPAVLVFRKGEQEKRFDGLAALDFIKCVDLSRPKAEAAAVPEGMVDVLATAAAPVVETVPVQSAVPVVEAPAEQVSAPVSPVEPAPVPEIKASEETNPVS